MTQDKMRKIIVACVCAGTLLLCYLVGYLCYQWITMAVLDNSMEKLENETARYEQMNTEMKDELSFLESEMGKDWLAFQEGFVRDNK